MALNSSTQKAEVGRSEFQDNLGYIEKLSPKTKRKKKAFLIQIFCALKDPSFKQVNPSLEYACTSYLEKVRDLFGGYKFVCFPRPVPFHH